MRPRTAGTTRRIALALGAIVLLCVTTLRAQDERTRIPQLQPPPPVDPRFLQRFEGSICTIITDASFRTGLGQLVSFERLEIVLDPESAVTKRVHARLIRVVEPRFISPVDTISTPFDPFIEIPGPRTRIDRLVIEDGTVGTHAHPSQYEGRWLWLARNVDIDLRDITIGGTPLAARIVSAVASAENKGRPVILRAGSAAVRRGSQSLEIAADVRLAGSDVSITGTMRRDGAYSADVRATPVAFADLRAFLRELPAEGSAEIDATVTNMPGGVDVALRTFNARARSSMLSATGTLRTGEGGSVRGLVVDLPALVAADLDTLLGVSIPVGGVWRGGFRADGPLASGVSVTGSLERMDVVLPGGSPPPPHIAIEGIWRNEPGVAVDVRLDALAIPVREGSATGNIAFTGPPDSLAIGGSVRVAGLGAAEEILARIDALVLDRADAEHPLLRGEADVTARLPSAGSGGAREVRARAEGSVALAEDGRVDARLVTEPLPLALLPLPGAVDSVGGEARADLRLTGTAGAPVLAGTVDVRDGRFRVPAARVSVSALGGSIPISDGIADLGGMTATANGGTLAVDGTVRLMGGERIADVSVRAEDVALAGDDSARVVASGDLTALGALASPRIGGALRVELDRRGGSLPLATIDGSIDVGRDRAVVVDVRADSLPLDALPAPSAVRDLHGAVRGALHLAGTLDSLTTDGVLEVQGDGVTVTRTGTVLDALHGRVFVRNGVVTLDGVRGTIGGGQFVMEGDARISGGPRTVNARVTVDSGRVADTDSMQIVASADLRATGALERPDIRGTVVLHEGWVHEDNFARRAPIDTAAPPYAELVARVPWIAGSRLRRGAPRPSQERMASAERESAESRDSAQSPGQRSAPLTGRIQVDIQRGVRLVDEDSEIRGVGTVYVTVDSVGVRTGGLYRIFEGYYAQYGSVFDIRGGSFLFAGEGLTPIVSMRSEHRFEAPLGIWITPGSRIMERFPPLQFFAFGSQDAGREVRRLSLMPESATELGALLLYDDEPQPVTGLRTRSFWAPDDGGDLFGESSATRGTVLLANYIANESYDYLPLERAYLRAGVIDIGPTRPGRITIGSYLQAGVSSGALRVLLTQPVVGGTAPGIRLRYRLGAPELLAFSEPRFLSIAPLIPGEVFTHGRRTGLGIRWLWEW